MKRIFIPTFLVLVVLFLNVSKSYSQINFSPFNESDYDLLKKHINENLSYPKDAYLKGIQGVSYIQLTMYPNGNLIKNSVKVIVKLYPSCDSAAIAAVKSFTGKLNSAALKSIGVRQDFILPVKFAIDDRHVQFPSHVLGTPLGSVIERKDYKTSEPNWAVYSMKGFNRKIGEITPGDSVHVIGWSAWCYFIQSGKIAGYVSHNALAGDIAMKDIRNQMMSMSENEETLESDERSQLLKIDTIPDYEINTAYLSLSTDKKNVFCGECATVTLTFNVQKENKIRLSFVDLPTQIGNLSSSLLDLPYSFSYKHNIENIDGVKVLIDGKEFLQYTIYRATYCPTSNHGLNFTRIPLKMLVKTIDDVVDQVVVFHTDALKISARPLPDSNSPTSFSDYKMVGNFRVTDRVESSKVTKGMPFRYELELSNDGITFPIEPAVINNPDIASVKLLSIEDSIKVNNGELQTTKKFVYHLVPSREGEIDFSKLIKYTFFDPATSTYKVIRPKSKVAVVKDDNIAVTSHEPTMDIRKYTSKVIVVDISESMQMEDYKPNRLEAVKNGIKTFLDTHKDCDFNIIVFGGNAQIIIPEKLGCYDDVDLINLPAVSRGTAIGDALWLALITMKSGMQKKIVLIGDGDNNTGTISPRYAVDLARRFSVTVDVIGVGSKGRVQYGFDDKGRPQFYENTFSDYQLKQIAISGKGKYHHAKDASDIAEILQRAFID